MATYDIHDLGFDNDTPDTLGSQKNSRSFDVAETGGGAAAALVYRMRGFDQNVAVNDYVFWDSSEVDDDASEYTGSAGPVVDIVVHRKQGTA